MLNFVTVPHWGWRATDGDRIFEIERLSADTRQHAIGEPRYRAYERKKGQQQPVAQGPFANSVLARAWLEQRAKHKANAQ
jgi:hypothetical protein